MSEEKITKVSIIVSKGSLEGIYPGLIMANGARAEGMDANLFFTFFGLDAVHRTRIDHIKVATVGNPAMHIPTLMGALPGMSALATHMMNKKMEELDIPPIHEFIVRRHVRPQQRRLRPASEGHHHRWRLLRPRRRWPDHLHLVLTVCAEQQAACLAQFGK